MNNNKKHQLIFMICFSLILFLVICIVYLLFSNFLQFSDVIVYTLQNKMPALIILLVISIMISFLMSCGFLTKIKMQRYYDALTGVYNPRAGFRMLQKLYDNAKYQKRTLSVCMIQVDGLKEVIESFGLKAGNELILSVRDGIKTHIRQSDIMIRVQEDIFLIALITVNYAKAQEIWQRIDQEYQLYNETGNRPFMISVSHGVGEFKFTLKENIEDVINWAVIRMNNDKAAQ